VAGYDADVVLLKAKDNIRFSQRLWAERQTGLLLRSETLGLNGQPLESAAFSELSIGVKPQPEVVVAAMRKLDGYRVLRPTVQAATLEGEGWSMSSLPPGFREVHCAKRSLDPMGTPGLPRCCRPSIPMGSPTFPCSSSRTSRRATRARSASPSARPTR
jgi:sigma-E factor negative regulatory protein RseB